MTSEPYYAEAEDDLDKMLFSATNCQEEALTTLRREVGNFIDDEFGLLVDEVLQKKYFYASDRSMAANEFYRYFSSFGKKCPDLFSVVNLKRMGHEIQFEDLYTFFSIHYASHPRERGERFFPQKQLFEKKLLHWGNHLKTEIQNDGFDDSMIRKKLVDLAATLSFIDTMLI